MAAAGIVVATKALYLALPGYLLFVGAIIGAVARGAVPAPVPAYVLAVATAGVVVLAALSYVFWRRPRVSLPLGLVVLVPVGATAVLAAAGWIA